MRSSALGFSALCLILALVQAQSAETGLSRADEECGRRFRVIMHFECRSLPSGYCEPYRQLYGELEDTELLIEKKCCQKRCSIRTLRSLCCFL